LSQKTEFGKFKTRKHMLDELRIRHKEDATVKEKVLDTTG